MESKYFVGEPLIRYIESVSPREHPVLAALREETDAHPERRMQITALQGQLLQLLVMAIGARRTIEVGVFTGYSSLAVALALPEDGHVTALDRNLEYTSVARRYWALAGVAQKIDLQIGPAAESLDAMIAAGQTYDFAFIDADKTGYLTYFEKCLVLIRKGGLMAFDNTLRDATVLDPRNLEPDTIAIRQLNATLRDHPAVLSCLLPVADGLTLAVKR